MGRIGVKIGLERILGALLQVIVLAHQLFQLGLHIDNLLRRELVFHHGDTRGLKMGEEAGFARLYVVLLALQGLREN